MSYELRPLSLAELLDRAFGIYRRHFLLFVGIMALPSLVMLVFSVGIQFLDAPPPQPAGTEPDPAQLIGAAAWVISGFIVLMTLYWITYAVALGASTFAVSRIYRVDAPTIARSYAALQGRIGRLAWLLLQIFLRLFGVVLMVLAAILILGAILLVLSPVLGAIMVFVAVGAASLAFCWMTLRYAVAVPIAVLEDNTALESIRRSIELTKGNLTRVFVLLLFTVIVNYAGMMLFQGPFFVAAIVAGPETSTGFWVNMGGVITGSIAAALTSPLAVVAMAVLYYDLRIRKEGLDLEVMIADLRGDDSVPAGPPDAGGGRGLFLAG